jgi:hypothetical protein
MRRWEQLQRSARKEVRSFDRLRHSGHLAAVQALIAAGEQARVTANVPVKCSSPATRFQAGLQAVRRGWL